MERVDYQPFLVQDVINWHRADGLNLRPWYQRRLTWTNQQRAYLVNTLFMQMPVPSIYLRHYLDADKEESKREIVDGQQRIHSILTYVEDGFRAKHPNHKKPVLYSELKPREREAFRLTQLSIGVLLGATDEDVIEIFGRINSVMKTLNRQEKRNSKYSGEFKQFCLRQSAKRLAIWKGLGIFTPNNIVRMAEVQFVAELVINLVEGIVDYNAKQIDQYYEMYDENFPIQDEVGQKFERVFEKIVSLDPNAIKDTIFRRSPLFFLPCSSF